MPNRLRGERLYVEAQLLPNYLAPSHFPDPLLAQIGAVPVGSRAGLGTYETKSRSDEVVTRRLILAVADAGLERLEQLVDSSGTTRTAQQAFSEIRKLDGLEVADLDQILVGVRPVGEEAITWEAVLHPGDSVHGEPEPLDPATMQKWFALVEELGGRTHKDYVRTVGGLTFAPVVLSPSGVVDLARFNPLRALRPMPTIRPRPAFGVRTSARLVGPAVTTPASQHPRVAVFDGGIAASSVPGTLFPDDHIDLTQAPVIKVT